MSKIGTILPAPSPATPEPESAPSLQMPDLVGHQRSTILQWLRALFPLLLVVLASAVVLRNGFAGVIDYTDADLPFDPRRELWRWAFTWRAQLNGGYANADLRLIPFSFLAMLAVLGVPINVITHLYSSAALAIFGLGSFRLARTFPGPRRRPESALLAACVVTFSPFIIQTFQQSVDMLYALGMSVFGLSFAVQLPGKRRKIVPAAFAAASFSAAAIDPFVLTLGLVDAALILCALSAWRGGWRGAIGGVGEWLKILLLVSAFSAYWVLPTLVESRLVGSGYESRSATQLDEATSVISYLSNYTQPYNLIRLMRGTDPGDVTGLHPFESNPLLIWSSTFLISLAYLPLLRRRRSFLIVALIAISVAAEVLASGLRPPLGLPFSILWDHAPGMRLFRDPLKFLWLAAPIVTAMLCWTANALLSIAVAPKGTGGKRQAARSSSVVFLILVAIAFLLGYGSFFQDDVARNTSGAEIPPAYYQASDWLAREAPQGRVFVLPAVAWALDFTWTKSPLGMIDPLNTLSARPLQTSYAAYSLAGALAQNQRWQEEIAMGDIGSAVRSLGDSGIALILLRDDLKPDELAALHVPLAALSGALHSPQANEFISSGPTFGPLEVFRLKPQYVRPEMTLVSPLEDSAPVDRGPGNGGVDFVQDGPTRYRVFLQHARAGDVLILREAFNSGWILHLKPQLSPPIGFSKPRPLLALFPFDDSFAAVASYPSKPATAFATSASSVNSWAIPAAGSYVGTLEFSPQQFWAWGWVGTISIGLTLGTYIAHRMLAAGTRSRCTRRSAS